MKHIKFGLIYLGILLSLGCVNTPDLPHGIWRAVVKTESGTEIPFNFELSDSHDGKVLYIINGSERLKVDNVAVNGDSVTIKLPLFDSEIRAKILDNQLDGKWIRHLPNKNLVMSFSAKSGTSWRFYKTRKSSQYNVSGRWSTTFISKDGEDTTKAVGEFQQNGSKVTGTFLTPTGDYRFLEGTISGNRLHLSTFDGSNALLFTGKLQGGETIVEGKFYSGPSSVKNWTAKKDDQAILPDAYSLTKLKEGNKTISFSFPDMDGKQVSLSDDRFKNRVVIVQFLGSWCPNCMDETAFLAPLYKKHKDKGLEIIGLAYERSSDFNIAKSRVRQLQERFDITYPLLVTGFTNKEVLKSMPALNEFKAFPTTILVDKKGLVRKIHTGFSGPGTGQHYSNFTSEFEKEIQQLLAED